MIKKFYVFAWLLLVGSVLLLAINGPLSGLQIVVFSLIGLGLVYALALWVVLVKTEERRTQ